jgi:hypothetical protein
MQNSVNHREPDLGHASNQIGKTKKPVRVTRVYPKLGEVCELDLGHASNQIGQQKITMKALAVKFRNIYLQNFAKTLSGKFRNIYLQNFTNLLV